MALTRLLDVYSFGGKKKEKEEEDEVFRRGNIIKKLIEAQ